MSDFESCGVCGRTILRGERAASYVDPDRATELVCALCKGRAEASGWLPASVAESMPAPSPKRRRGAVALRERLVALRTAVEPEAPDSSPDSPPTPPPPPRTSLEVFNSSGEARKVAGLRKSLGDPRVTVRQARRGGEVITVAWDLSWYRWIVRGESVKQIAKGNEISELPLEDRAWNAAAGEDGTLSLV